MLTKTILKEIIAGQKAMFLDTAGSFNREILDSSDFQKAISQTNEIVIITGVRRCGKSYFLRLLWQDIKNRTKTNDNQFLYLNFEDERLVGFQAEDFNSLLESYLELFEANSNKKIYLFFDEIQNIFGWAQFLNRLRESKKYKIFITGSNASLLSKEISTQLTGRNISASLYPFSWKEYLGAKMPDLEKKHIYTLDKKIKIKKIFNNYLEFGGFPEIIKTGFKPLLQEYLKNIIYRDIFIRYRIKYEASLREMVNFLLVNIGNILSLQNIARMAKIKNIATVKNYHAYLENSFLFYFVPMHSYSVKQQIYNPDKVYVCDLGIYNELSFKFSRNFGKVLENLVFLELKRRYPQIYYGFDEKYREIDFIVCENNKIKLLVQSCFDASDSKTKERETASLRKFMQKHRVKSGLVITDDYENEENYPEGKIDFVPAWKYFLE